MKFPVTTVLAMSFSRLTGSKDATDLDRLFHHGARVESGSMSLITRFWNYDSKPLTSIEDSTAIRAHYGLIWWLLRHVNGLCKSYHTIAKTGCQPWATRAPTFHIVESTGLMGRKGKKHVPSRSSAIIGNLNVMEDSHPFNWDKPLS